MPPEHKSSDSGKSTPQEPSSPASTPVPPVAPRVPVVPSSPTPPVMAAPAAPMVPPRTPTVPAAPATPTVPPTAVSPAAPSPAPTAPTATPVAPTPAPVPPSGGPAPGSTELPLRSPDAIDLSRFNALTGDWAGKPVENIRNLFVKPVILQDGSQINVETLKVPGFIGISDAPTVSDPEGKQVSGHASIVKFLEAYGLLICTYQWNKERYGTPFDLRQPIPPELFTEGFIKNEGHHSGAIVPAMRSQNGQLTPSFGTFNEPDDYHRGMYGKDGFVAVAQRLVFPDFVTPTQARGYTDTIINWMALLNPFIEFPFNYNGGDPVGIVDRPTLKQFLKNGLLACLGDAQAIAFFKKPENMCYCAEFMFVGLNTPVFPFNRAGLTRVLDGDADKAAQILAVRDAQNRREENPLSKRIRNPEFNAFNIPMPVVPEDLVPLDELMTRNGQSIADRSIPLPPFKISQVIRRAYRTLLPRHQFNEERLAQAQARLFKGMEPALLQQLGLRDAPATDPKVQAVSQYVTMVSQKLEQPFSSYEAFDQEMDRLMEMADQMLVGQDDRTYFMPPRVYIDLGQNDGDTNLPQGWGFRLQTIGALVARSTLR